MGAPSITELFDLSGKGVVVTGGGQGIGQAIVFRLTEAGARIMIADVDMKAANKTVDKVSARGGEAKAIQADVSSGEDAKKVMQATVDAFGSLDILVNNAGIFPLVPVMEVTEEIWDRVLNINLKGAFLCSQAAAAIMGKDGQGGKIINLASIDGIRPNGRATHYNSSKGGMLMLTKALALELSPMGIHVNSVAPGGIITPGTAEVGKKLIEDTGKDPIEAMGNWVDRVPLQRMGEPDDIAKVVLFLASGAADYITGENIVADGGYLLS